MKVSATIKSRLNQHEAIVQTNGTTREINIQPKTTGFGSSVNGAELLLLSIATCFCNDIYREAEKRKIRVQEVEVHATGEFGGEGEPGFNFEYKAEVISDATPAEVEKLIRHVNEIAEIHKTLRQGIQVNLK